ncbi:TFIIB-domain-containing protein [Guyanagaster necrorhizus]|uniref:Transcription initiation factor IIB n=1 Tax=Guyanagaster necrorhizus TaxID=856835 RepID=A0A9P8AXU1_9AGAR|nr:TFIIB-domain-containing protein [Guyanagaster necrorhizus MCA 3950]KAG7451745.1 TFIIB-domain-containing protein [Guyanagaster necrorhizus MCA 3950]
MDYAQVFAQAFALAQFQAPPPPTFLPDLAVRLICPECKDPHPQIAEEFSSGDLVCRTCGLVLGDRIVDTRSEWRTFANDERDDDPSRVGAASDPLMEGMEQLDTAISFRDGRNGLSRELRRAQSRGQGSRQEQNLMVAFRDISSWCDQISLPKVVSDTAKQIFKHAEQGQILRGKPTDAIIAACIFIACRQAHVPRTFREMCDLTRVSKKVLGQCYKSLEHSFNLTVGASATHPSLAPSIGPESLVGRYCNHLDLPPNFQVICSDIIMAARELGIGHGRSPVSIAGGAIYFTCLLLGKPKSTRDIGAVAGVSEGTIKLVYRSYLVEKDKLVKQKWIDDGKANPDNLKGAV